MTTRTPTTPAASTTPAISVRNPGDGRVVGTVPDASADDVAAAVGGLREAQGAWESVGPEARAEWLRRWRDWILDHDDHLADTIQSETAAPRPEAQLEVLVIVDALNHLARNAVVYCADERPRPHNALTATKRLRIRHRPYPVVGIITPWNFPFFLPAVDAIPALTAGAAVLLKPSEITPLSAVELARGWREIGAPPVFDCITGTGATGVALIDHVDFIQFTGSTRTGRAVARQAAERLIPCGLELGGKDAAIVLADADLDRAANGIAFGALMKTGQMCTSVERVYVEDAVHDEFVKRLVREVRSLRQGLGDAAEVDVSVLATEAQVRIVQSHVEDAVERGATVLTGGARTGTGTGFEPTVLVDVDHTMACMRDETFGPTIPVMRVADEDEAVTLANDSSYGLSASVWTRDIARGRRIAERLEVGGVNVDDVFSNAFCQPLPQGGWRESGLGARMGGASGVHKYCRRQAITEPRLPTPAREVLWFPYTRRRSTLVSRLLRFLVARDIRRRLGQRRTS